MAEITKGKILFFRIDIAKNIVHIIPKQRLWGADI